MIFTAFSKAAHSTWNHFKNLHLLIDAGEGVATKLEIGEVSALRAVLLTHCHMDHVAGLPQLLHLRARFDLPPLPVYHANPCLRLRLIDLMVNPNGTKPLAEFIELRLTDRLMVGKITALLQDSFPSTAWNPPAGSMWIEPFEVLHDVGSGKNAVGYKLFERRSRLKERYRGLPGDAIAGLARGGTDVNEPIDHHLLTYTGDTRPLDPAVLGRPRLLMHDATYPVADMEGTGHDHSTLDDALAAAGAVGCALAVNHLSLRYREAMPIDWRSAQVVLPSDEPTIVTIPN